MISRRDCCRSSGKIYIFIYKIIDVYKFIESNIDQILINRSYFNPVCIKARLKLLQLNFIIDSFPIYSYTSI